MEQELRLFSGLHTASTMYVHLHTQAFSLSLPPTMLRSEGRRKGANGCQVVGMVSLSKLSIPLIRTAQRGMRSADVRGIYLF